MSDLNKDGPSWARTQQRTTGGGNWGPRVFILAAGVLAVVLVLGVVYSASNFGGPSPREIARVRTEFTAKFKADDRAFETEFKADDVADSLKAQALAAPGGFVRAADNIKREHAIVAKYHALHEARLSDLRRRAAALYSNPALRDRTLDKFDAARAE
jgi:hypothetical protein